MPSDRATSRTHPRYCVRIGVNWPGISFMLAARQLGASCERTLTIGRQNLFGGADQIAAGYADGGMSISADELSRVVRDGDGFVEALLRHMGAVEVDSIDASGYEGCTIVHDLNQPIPEHLHNRYSLVFDGGSLEHVFNFPQALKNCMEAVAVGGHLLMITPGNNLFGHGFYQFSPELFYRVLTPVNGFEVIVILMRASHRWARWHLVSDPEAVGSRVTLTSPWPSLVFVLAKRTKLVAPLAEWPQQSDYAAAWADPARPVSRVPAAYELLPAPVRRVTRLAAAVFGTTSDRSHFQTVEMRAVAAGDYTRGRS